MVNIAKKCSGNKNGCIDRRLLRCDTYPACGGGWCCGAACGCSRRSMCGSPPPPRGSMLTCGDGAAVSERSKLVCEPPPNPSASRPEKTYIIYCGNTATSIIYVYKHSSLDDIHTAEQWANDTRTIVQLARWCTYRSTSSFMILVQQHS